MADSQLPPFMDPDSEEAAILETILEIAGPNFGSSYVGDAQPNDMVEANRDILIKFDGPGGTGLQGTAFPGGGGNMGTAINSMLSILSPFVSGYALLMPIFGIIIGIIEVICSLLNPWAVGEAVKRLFEKWIPAFVSLFPPLAGVVVAASVIKAILAISYYVMTEIVPTIELIVTNMIALAEAFEDGDNITEAQVRASLQKFTNVLDTLIQKVGIFEVFRPLLEFIFLILLLLLGMPCDPEDNLCCGNLYCPDFLTSPVSGEGLMIVSSFGDCNPGFVFSILTINPDLAPFAQLQQNFKQQLDCQLDEPIDDALPMGSEAESSSLLKIRITSKRGPEQSITIPVLSVTNSTIKVNNLAAMLFAGQTVEYEVIPDFYMMVSSGIVGIGCNPEVAVVKENIRARFPQLGASLIDNNPELGTVVDDYTNISNLINQTMENIRDIIDEVPPITDQPDRIREESNTLVGEILKYTDGLKDTLNSLILRNVSSASGLDVNKRAVTADAVDAVTVVVTPRDITGAPLLLDVPEGVGVSVEILTDFGSLTNKTINTTNGTVTAEIRSPRTGTANIRAKVGGILITNFDATIGETVKVLEVKFVSEAVLPKRRRKSKPHAGKSSDTGLGSDREPGRG